MTNQEKEIQTKEKMHTIAVYVQNQPGVLGRIALVFSRRGFNIESLVVSSSYQDERYSTMTITAKGDSQVLIQIIKHLKKLVNVVHALEYLGEGETLEREIALVKVKSNPADRAVILQIIDHFNAKTVDLTFESLIVQVTGSTEKINACINMLKRENIIEVIRSGKVLMKRGLENT